MKTRVDAYATRAQEAMKEIPDFNEVVNRDVKLHPVMGHIILESEIGPLLAYHFGKHPEEAARIAQMDPQGLISTMHRLEGRLLAERDSRGAQPPKPRIPGAPPPPPPVPSGAASTVATPETARSYKEFEEARARQLAGRATR